MSSYEFDRDTAVELDAPGHYLAQVHERWSIGTIANGGYVMSIGMRALGEALGAVDPLSVTAHFVRPTLTGPLAVRTEVVKRGRQYVTGVARLIQGEKEVVRLLGTYGDLSRHGGPTRVSSSPPLVPAPDTGISGNGHPAAPAIADRYDLRLAEETMGWMRGERSDRAEIRGAARFRDGRPADVWSLAAFADGFPPPAFAWLDPTWLPTLTLTLHVRARPEGAWLHSMFRTRFLFGGLLEEDGEIWDERGRLVALSRQLAAVSAFPDQMPPTSAAPA